MLIIYYYYILIIYLFRIMLYNNVNQEDWQQILNTFDKPTQDFSASYLAFSAPHFYHISFPIKALRCSYRCTFIVILINHRL